MALDAKLLRDSFDLIVERAPNLTERFYDILFERHPQTRGMFQRNGRKQQEQMLTAALAGVLDHLDDVPWLSSQLGALGRRHEGYGVTREMYAWVGGALLATLEEVAGPDWSPALETAWTDAYAVIVSLMTTPAPAPRAAPGADHGRPAAASTSSCFASTASVA